jgi:hypothetical protein
MSKTGVMVHIFEAPETKEQYVPLPVRIMMCVSIKVSLLGDEYTCYNYFRTHVNG